MSKQFFNPTNELNANGFFWVNHDFSNAHRYERRSAKGQFRSWCNATGSIDITFSHKHKWISKSFLWFRLFQTTPKILVKKLIIFCAAYLMNIDFVPQFSRQLYITSKCSRHVYLADRNSENRPLDRHKCHADMERIRIRSNCADIMGLCSRERTRICNWFEQKHDFVKYESSEALAHTE